MTSIYVIDTSYDTNEYSEELPSAVLQQVREFVAEQDELADVESTDIGSGADLPAILIEFGWQLPVVLAVGIFFLGSKINSNLEAWIEIAKKTKYAFEKIQSLFAKCVVDPDAAFLVGLSSVLEKHGMCSHVEVIESIALSSALDGVVEFDKDRIQQRSDWIGYWIWSLSYVFAYKLDHSDVYVVVVSNNGETILVHRC